VRLDARRYPGIPSPAQRLDALAELAAKRRDRDAPLKRR